MSIGDKVKVKEPFSFTFSGVYTIMNIQDGVYFLEGIEGGFDATYLVEV